MGSKMADQSDSGFQSVKLGNGVKCIWYSNISSSFGSQRIHISAFEKEILLFARQFFTVLYILFSILGCFTNWISFRLRNSRETGTNFENLLAYQGRIDFWNTFSQTSRIQNKISSQWFMFFPAAEIWSFRDKYESIILYSYHFISP